MHQLRISLTLLSVKNYYWSFRPQMPTDRKRKIVSFIYEISYTSALECCVMKWILLFDDVTWASSLAYIETSLLDGNFFPWRQWQNPIIENFPFFLELKENNNKFFTHFYYDPIASKMYPQQFAFLLKTSVFCQLASKVAVWKWHSIKCKICSYQRRVRFHFSHIKKCLFLYIPLIFCHVLVIANGKK